MTIVKGLWKNHDCLYSRYLLRKPVWDFCTDGLHTCFLIYHSSILRSDTISDIGSHPDDYGLSNQLTSVTKDVQNIRMFTNVYIRNYDNHVIWYYLQLMISENESMRVGAEKEIFDARLQLEEDKQKRMWLSPDKLSFIIGLDNSGGLRKNSPKPNVYEVCNTLKK